MTGREQMKVERRRLERVNLIHYLRVFNRDDQSLIGNLVDVNKDGIRLISEKSWPKGAQQRARMEFPEEVSGHTFVEYDLETVWCEPDPNQTLFGLGCRLISITPEVKTIIKLLIEMYQDSE